MAATALASRLERFDLGRTALFGLAALIAAELSIALAYATSPLVAGVTDPVSFGFVLLQPFIWINVGVLAVLTTAPPAASTARRRLGIALAVGYFVVLSYFGGLWALGGMGTGTLGVNWLLPPGYSPRLFYDGVLVSATAEPYKLVGYAALAYLVYVTILDAAGSAISGVVGLFSCVSCSWPILGTIAASVFGGSSAIASAAMEQAYPLSTLVFLSAVALLWWRPSFR